MSERKFKVGDRVVIRTKWSQFNGLSGTVSWIADEYVSNFPYDVELDNYPCGTPFNEDELMLEEERVTQ